MTDAVAPAVAVPTPLLLSLDDTDTDAPAPSSTHTGRSYAVESDDHIQWSSYQTLWCHVLISAIRIYSKESDKAKVTLKVSERLRETIDWFFNDTSEALGSVKSICELLDIEVDALRRRLIQIAKSPQRTKVPRIKRMVQEIKCLTKRSSSSKKAPASPASLRKKKVYRRLGLGISRGTYSPPMDSGSILPIAAQAAG